MKRILFVILLAVLSIFGSVAISESSDFELTDMSIDELLSLRDQVDLALFEKGYAVYTDISHGDKGDHVAKLQQQLKDYGYYTGKISGKYDTTTEKAVKQFQKDNGLDVSGTATAQMQSLLYSNEISSLVTATPKPTLAPTPTADPLLSEYAPVEYDDCARYPDKYNYTKAQVTGKVLQVIGTRDTGFEIRLATSGSDDVFFIQIKKGLVDYNILENDRLCVYGMMNGLYSYTSTWGVSITIPYMKADSVILK